MSGENTQLDRSTNRWMVAGIVLMVIGLLAFPLYRIYEPTIRAEAAEETQANLASVGVALWTSTCASCHGANGAGVDAPALNSIQFLTISTDEQIFSIASSGVPGTDMAAYSQQFGGPLTRQQIAALTACIRSWEEDAPDRPDWRDMMVPVEEGEAHGHDDEPDAHGDEETTEGPAPCGPDYDPENFEAAASVDESEPHVDEVPHGEEPAEEPADESVPHVDEVPHDENEVAEEPACEEVVEETPDHVDVVPHDDEPAKDGACPTEEQPAEGEPDHVDEVPHG